jgi:hypothetical protein
MRRPSFRLSSRLSSRLAWLLPIAFFFVNPGLACGPAEPQYRYGAAEMRAAVEGVWSFTIAPQDGSPVQHIAVHLEQAASAPQLEKTASAPGRSLVRAAWACGNRTLVRSAGACVDSSTMPLAVTVLSGDLVLSSGTLSGSFRVDGLTFTFGDLVIDLGPYQILMRVDVYGNFNGVHLGPGGAPGSLTIITRA